MYIFAIYLRSLFIYRSTCIFAKNTSLVVKSSSQCITVKAILSGCPTYNFPFWDTSSSRLSSLSLPFLLSSLHRLLHFQVIVLQGPTVTGLYIWPIYGPLFHIPKAEDSKVCIFDADPLHWISKPNIPLLAGCPWMSWALQTLSHMELVPNLFLVFFF